MSRPTGTPRTAAAAAGRHADSARRRQRVISVLDQATANGTQISVAGIARAAGVDRSFLYRHRDLLEQLHAAEAQPHPAGGLGPTVSRASLQADLANGHVNRKWPHCSPLIWPHLVGPGWMTRAGRL